MAVLYMYVCWKSLIQVHQLLDNLWDFLCKDSESNIIMYFIHKCEHWQSSDEI